MKIGLKGIAGLHQYTISAALPRLGASAADQYHYKNSGKPSCPAVPRRGPEAGDLHNIIMMERHEQKVRTRTMKNHCIQI